MIQPNWQPLRENLIVDALPSDGLWVCAVEYVTGPRKFKILASGWWDVIKGVKTVGPEGDLTDWDSGSAFLMQGTCRGALIAKIGGGTVDKVGTLFPVGVRSVIEIADSALPGGTGPIRGSLFLSMNDEPKNFQRHTGSITVSIWEAV